MIHRSDNSGTTYNLTEYLNSVSTQWKSGVGKGVAVNWPVGVGARGSSGVAATLSQTNGGITYVDVAYSLKSHFKIAAVKNRAGVFQLPGLTRDRRSWGDDPPRRAEQQRHFDRQPVESVSRSPTRSARSPTSSSPRTLQRRRS